MPEDAVDTALIVFIIGTVASFLPMYWLALRLLGRQRRQAAAKRVPARIGSVPAGRREFFDLLRHEAALRAIAVLREAIVEARLAAAGPDGDHHALSARTRQSLHDAGRLVDSLFTRELCRTFRDGVESMMTATSGSIGQASVAATAAIAALERVIDAGRPAVAAERAHKRGFLAALRDWRRGWLRAGDVGATA